MLMINGDVVDCVDDGTTEYIVVVRQNKKPKLYKRGGNSCGAQSNCYKYEKVSVDSYMLKDTDRNMGVVYDGNSTNVFPLVEPLSSTNTATTTQEYDPMLEIVQNSAIGTTATSTTAKPMTTMADPVTSGTKPPPGGFRYEGGEWFGNMKGTANAWFGPQLNPGDVPGTNIANEGRVFGPSATGRGNINDIPNTNIRNVGTPFGALLDDNHVPGTGIKNVGPPFGALLDNNRVPGTNIANSGPPFGRLNNGNVIPGTNIANSKAASQVYNLQQGGLPPAASQVYNLQQGGLPLAASQVYNVQQGGLPPAASQVYNLQQGGLPPAASQVYNLQQGGLPPAASQIYNVQKAVGMPNPMTNAVGVIKNDTPMPLVIPAGFSTGQTGAFTLNFPQGVFQALPDKRIIPGSKITFQLYTGDTQNLSQITGRTGLTTNVVYVSTSSIPMGMGGYFTLPPNQQVYVYRV